MYRSLLLVMGSYVMLSKKKYAKVEVTNEKIGKVSIEKF